MTAAVPATAGSRAVADTGDTGDPADRNDSDADEVGRRGRTTIADRVVTKVAAQAATEVDRAAGLRRSVAGRSLGRPRVRAHVDLDGAVAALELDLAVDYPAPVRQITRAVRQHVGDRVGTLCGVQVDHVDITVAALRRPPAEQRRRVL